MPPPPNVAAESAALPKAIPPGGGADPTAAAAAAGKDAPTAEPFLPIKFVAVTDAFDAPHSGGPKKLAVAGGLTELGGWSLGGSLPLEQVRREGEHE